MPDTAGIVHPDGRVPVREPRQEVREELACEGLEVQRTLRGEGGHHVGGPGLAHNAGVVLDLDDVHQLGDQEGQHLGVHVLQDEVDALHGSRGHLKGEIVSLMT